MAEQIISPGVFTRENDLSFLPQGIGVIGAAIIGPTVKGPAFVPTVINSFGDFTKKFGDLSHETFIPQTVKEYLGAAGSVTVCRVLAGGGYTYENNTNEFFCLAVRSGSGAPEAEKGLIVATIFPSKQISKPSLHQTQFGSASSTVNSINYGSNGFTQLDNSTSSLQLAGTAIATQTKTVSFNPAASNYFADELGYNANTSKTGVVIYSGSAGFAYNNFESLQTSVLTAGAGNAGGSLTAYASASGFGFIGSGSHLQLITQSGDLTFNGGIGQAEGYGYASTPWITSQLFNGNNTGKELFKIHSIAHGTSCNTDYKVSITNLREPADLDGKKQYSTFTVEIRKIDNIDKNSIPVE